MASSPQNRCSAPSFARASDLTAAKGNATRAQRRQCAFARGADTRAPGERRRACAHSLPQPLPAARGRHRPLEARRGRGGRVGVTRRGRPRAGKRHGGGGAGAGAGVSAASAAIRGRAGLRVLRAVRGRSLGALRGLGRVQPLTQPPFPSRRCWAWTPPHGAGRFGGKSCKTGCLQAFGIDVCTPELAKTNSPGCSAGGIKRDRLRAETRVSRGAGATPLRPGARLGPAGCRETRR